MKYLFCLLLVSCLQAATATQVTFRVDLSEQVVSPLGVHIAGDFQSVAGFGSDWNPSSTPLSVSGFSSVYEITIDLPPGTYQYKYVNGNAWGMDENPQGSCSIGGTNNRLVEVTGQDVVLPVSIYNACPPSIQFSVNMNEVGSHSQGVYLIGDFQSILDRGPDWDPTALPMADINADGTYSITLDLPYGDYHYAFVNGTETESLSGNCATVVEGRSVRSLSLETGLSLSTPCYGTCDDCDPQLDQNYEVHWWNDAVFYEIFVRSFADSDGDGIGDFRGIIDRLDYLNDGDPETTDDLGITGIWLMPTMPSPSYHGYDVTDYYGVESDYGTMEDFELFIAEAHRRGIKVIIDLVLNHSSSQHPWFLESRNPISPYRDWYRWSDTDPQQVGPWGQQVWHRAAGAYYYGLFWGGMPDLNYGSQDVVEEMWRVTRYWQDKGVDGYRLDAIKHLAEDGDMLENVPYTFDLLEAFNDVYKGESPDALAVGEVWTSTANVAPYIQNDRLDLCFEFDLAGSIQQAEAEVRPTSLHDKMLDLQTYYPRLQYATFLSNHDMDRVFNNVGFDLNRMKALTSIYLTLPGVPFVYYGEEVGMQGAGAHENIRRPMQWSGDRAGGFSDGNPWIGLGNGYQTHNVEQMDGQSGSLLEHYRRLIHLRTQEKALRRGIYLPAESEAGNLAYLRVADNEGVLIVHNLGSHSIDQDQIRIVASPLTPGDYEIKSLLDNSRFSVIRVGDRGAIEVELVDLPIESKGSLQLKIAALPSATSEHEKVQARLRINNPVRDMLYLDTDGATITRLAIYDLQGKVVYTAQPKASEISISLGDLPAGTYIVQAVDNQDQPLSGVVIKQ